MKNIETEELILGNNVVIDPSAKIRGLNGKASRIVIGDNTYIGSDVQIICDHFEIGDYSKIQHHTNIHGYKPCIIGHNAWIGQYSIIDSIGGTTIGNNCGIGAHSQLWSHIKYGDTLEGCRFLSEASLEIGNDVWFVGHCIVSPIKAEDKSMALAGSVITKDMHFNQIYAGSPAKSISEKSGFQFTSVKLEDKVIKLNNYLLECFKDGASSIVIVTSESEIDFNDTERTYFNADNRKYTKRNTSEEVQFMKYLLPALAKFTPY